MWSEKISKYITLHQNELPGVDPLKPVHPTFFYEFVWCMAGFALLYLICKKCRKFSGQIFLCYGIWYGVGRTIIEGLRTDSLYVGTSSIRVSQLLSAALVVVCAVLLVVLLIKAKKNPKPIEGVDFFPETKPFFGFEKKRLAREQAAAEQTVKETEKDVHKD